MPNVAVSKEPRIPDFPCVQATGDQSHKVPEWHLPFEDGLSGEPPDSHNVVGGTNL